jgi:ribosome assembly protein YihI (activator of Der GTPase)
MQRSEKIKLVSYHYGRKHQCKKAIEEMAELTKALCKLDENPAMDSKNAKYIDNVLEEIADVIVMMEQLKLFFGQKQIEEIIDLKIDRQIERICMGRD